MNSFRRRDLLALAALPLGCLAQPPAAARKLESVPNAKEQDSKQPDAKAGRFKRNSARPRVARRKGSSAGFRPLPGLSLADPVPI